MGTGTPEGLRITFYSQDSFGLGNLPCLRGSLYPGFSDSQFGEFFPVSPHHNYIKLSSIAKDSPGNQMKSVSSENGFPATA
jgi:hypothetical protein